MLKVHIPPTRQVSKLFDQLSVGQLVWLPAHQIGYCQVDDTDVYNKTYFEKYLQYQGTEIWKSLNQFRLSFVARHYTDALIDVGIGCGDYITARRTLYPNVETWGFDINHVAVEWLQARRLYVNPYNELPTAITLWDVMEHIQDFPDLLARVQKWVFISTPIYHDDAHVLRSKHFRPDEHYWYFTHRGLVNIMRDLGFECVQSSDAESRIGREDIRTYAFKRMEEFHG
jgi:hypothetical protein